MSISKPIVFHFINQTKLKSVYIDEIQEKPIDIAT